MNKITYKYTGIIIITIYNHKHNCKLESSIPRHWVCHCRCVEFEFKGKSLHTKKQIRLDMVLHSANISMNIILYIYIVNRH